ncbi:MAG: class I SAM-dependent methyltransferase [Magnetococcales bacterium]|nr:class I SAM-dependent methyltransferase [Magnetococcales bacterium]
MNQAENYYDGINGHLFNQIPEQATTILEIGCGHGLFGLRFKEQHPNVIYHGMELVPAVARVAASRLDRVWCGDIESINLALIDSTFDCIIFGDVLEHLYNPLETLRKIRSLLNPGGCIVCCIPNVQHHSILHALLCGEFQYQNAGLLDRTHVRFFTCSSFIKLLLDAGFIPQLVDSISVSPTQEFFQALQPGLLCVKQDQAQSLFYLSSYQYIFKGIPNPASLSAETLQPVFPISFIVPTNDHRILQDNLLCSPIFHDAHPHQIILVENQPSAAQAIAFGLRQAVHECIVYAHQDVYLPRGWDVVYTHRLAEARVHIPTAALFGVYGVRSLDGQGNHHGMVMDRRWLRITGHPLPVEVDSLDEMLIGFNKSEFPGLDAGLGYHLYGTDMVCAYREMGKSAVVVDALCFHNSNTGLENPQALTQAAHHFVHSRWKKYLPIVTSCLTLEAEESQQLA